MRRWVFADWIGSERPGFVVWHKETARYAGCLTFDPRHSQVYVQGATVPADTAPSAHGHRRSGASGWVSPM
jgi:hypothetical protein